MERIRKLAVAATITTFLLVAIGGFVRATKSGMGCGDNWPHCPGEVTRATVIELSHRGVAGVLGVVLALLVVTAWRSRREHPRLLAVSAAAAALWASQALLGAVVVWLELRAESVVLHLVTAMALFAVLIYATAQTYRAADRPAPRADRGIAREAALAAAAVLGLLLVGSYVTGRGAGYVFPDWPLMDGRVVPDLGNELNALHFIHRALAAAVGIVVAVVALRIVRRKREFPFQARVARIAVAAFGLEIAIGALNVWTRLNAAAVTLHLALGALIWGLFVTLAVVSAPERVSARVRRWREPAAVEGGR